MSRLPHWQYQVKAEPPPGALQEPAPETITMDKWYRQPSEPVRTVPRMRVEMDWTVVPPLHQYVEYIPVESWYRQHPTPVWRSRLETGFYVLQQDPLTWLPPDIEVPVGWIVQSAEPIAEITHQYQAYFRPLLPDILIPPPITVADWFVQPINPILPRQGTAPTVQGDVYFEPLEPVPDVSMWYRQPSEPVRVKQQPIQPHQTFALEPSLLPVFGTAAALEWYVQASEPVRTVRPVRDYLTVGGEVIPFNILPEVDVATWFIQASEPLRPKPSPVAQGIQIFLTEPADLPQVFVSSWYVQPSEPVRVPPRIHPGLQWYVRHPFGEEIIVIPVTMDMWYKQPSEPVRVPRRVQEGWFSPSLEPVQIGMPSMDMWYRQPSEPVRPKPDVVRWAFGQFEFTAEANIVISLDQWYKQPSEPIQAPSPRFPAILGQQVGLGVPILDEPVDPGTVASWYRQHPEPPAFLQRKGLGVYLQVAWMAPDFSQVELDVNIQCPDVRKRADEVPCEDKGRPDEADQDLQGRGDEECEGRGKPDECE